MDDSKPKDRVSASKLLLAIGVETEAVLSLLHGFVEDINFPNSYKVKAIELIDKYDIKKEEVVVDNTEELERKLLENYNL